MLVGVHQNIGHGRIVQQRFKRTKSENLVQNFLRQPLPLLQIHGSGFANDQRFQNLADFAAHFFPPDFVEPVQIQFLNQSAVNGRLNRAEVGASG